MDSVGLILTSARLLLHAERAHPEPQLAGQHEEEAAGCEGQVEASGREQHR